MRARRRRHVSLTPGPSRWGLRTGRYLAVWMRRRQQERGGATVDASDQELHQYLFDLQGYLVLHNVLGAAEVAELNRLIDAQRLPGPLEKIRFGSAAGVHGP